MASPAALVQYMGNPLHSALGVRLLRLLGQPAVTKADADLTGKVVLVTGGTAGIGEATARALVALGAEVHVTGRNAERGQRVASELGCIYHSVDHSDMSRTRAFAQGLVESLGGRPLDILVNNAAAMQNRFGFTSEGKECCTAFNLLGFYALTQELLPSIASAPGGGRVVSSTSAGMWLYHLDITNLRALASGEAPWRTDEGYDAIKAYCITHRARVMLTQHWAAENGELARSVRFSIVHPGWVETPGLRSASAMRSFYQVTKPVLRDADGGADTLVWLAAGLEGAHLPNGGYYFDRKQRPMSMPYAATGQTPQQVQELVAFCEEMSQASPMPVPVPGPRAPAPAPQPHAPSGVEDAFATAETVPLWNQNIAAL